jgi:hypothetical protein
VETWPFQANRFFVLQLAKTESIITVQRGFRTKYHKEPPMDKTIREFCSKFEERCCLCASKRTSSPGSSPEAVDRVRESFTRNSINQHVAQAENWKCLLPIFIWKFAVTSIPLYLSVGLDVRLGVAKTPHLFRGLPGHPTSLHVTFSAGAMLKIKFKCPLYGEIYHSFDRESWLQLIVSMLIC